MEAPLPLVRSLLPRGPDQHKRALGAVFYAISGPHRSASIGLERRTRSDCTVRNRIPLWIEAATAGPVASRLGTRSVPAGLCPDGFPRCSQVMGEPVCGYVWRIQAAWRGLLHTPG